MNIYQLLNQLDNIVLRLPITAIRPHENTVQTPWNFFIGHKMKFHSFLEVQSLLLLKALCHSLMSLQSWHICMSELKTYLKHQTENFYQLWKVGVVLPSTLVTFHQSSQHIACRSNVQHFRHKFQSSIWNYYNYYSGFQASIVVRSYAESYYAALWNNT